MERDTEKLIIKWLKHKYRISIEDEKMLKQFLYDLQIDMMQNLQQCSVSGSLPPSPYIKLGVEAREYAKKMGELENGIVELSFYNGGVFVIDEWLGRIKEPRI